MSEGVRVEPRGAAAARCPMCHDLLADLAAGVPAPCPRCGTAHHRACADELFRCSVLGCGGALVDGGPEGPRTPTATIAERLRRRVQERARALAEGRAPPPPPRASDDEPDVPSFEPLERWGRFSRDQPELAIAALILIPLAAALVAFLALGLLTRL